MIKRRTLRAKTHTTAVQVARSSPYTDFPKAERSQPRVRLRWKVCYVPWVSFAGSVDVLITSQTRRLT